MTEKTIRTCCQAHLHLKDDLKFFFSQHRDKAVLVQILYRHTSHTFCFLQEIPCTWAATSNFFHILMNQPKLPTDIFCSSFPQQRCCKTGWKVESTLDSSWQRRKQERIHKMTVLEANSSTPRNTFPDMTPWLHRQSMYPMCMQNFLWVATGIQTKPT